MRDALPHLFAADPNLLHKLVTMLSPRQLAARGVPVCRVVHRPGTFVVTFPDAYHAGFNAGFNVAEAVNFAVQDWLPTGTDSVARYQQQQRPMTFSHDAMLLNIVAAGVAAAEREVGVEGGSAGERGCGVGEGMPAGQECELGDATVSSAVEREGQVEGGSAAEQQGCLEGGVAAEQDGRIKGEPAMAGVVAVSAAAAVGEQEDGGCDLKQKQPAAGAVQPPEPQHHQQQDGDSEEQPQQQQREEMSKHCIRPLLVDAQHCNSSCSTGSERVVKLGPCHPHGLLQQFAQHVEGVGTAVSGCVKVAACVPSCMELLQRQQQLLLRMQEEAEEEQRMSLGVVGQGEREAAELNAAAGGGSDSGASGDGGAAAADKALAAAATAVSGVSIAAAAAVACESGGIAAGASVDESLESQPRSAEGNASNQQQQQGKQQQLQEGDQQQEGQLHHQCQQQQQEQHYEQQHQTEPMGQQHTAGHLHEEQQLQQDRELLQGIPGAVIAGEGAAAAAAPLSDMKREADQPTAESSVAIPILDPEAPWLQCVRVPVTAAASTATEPQAAATAAVALGAVPAVAASSSAVARVPAVARSHSMGSSNFWWQWYPPQSRDSLAVAVAAAEEGWDMGGPVVVEVGRQDDSLGRSARLHKRKLQEPQKHPHQHDLLRQKQQRHTTKSNGNGNGNSGDQAAELATAAGGGAGAGVLPVAGGGAGGGVLPVAPWQLRFTQRQQQLMEEPPSMTLTAAAAGELALRLEALRSALAAAGKLLAEATAGPFVGLCNSRDGEAGGGSQCGGLPPRLRLMSPGSRAEVCPVTGMLLNTCSLECALCGGDLSLAAVVSERQPDVAVCLAHAGELLGLGDEEGVGGGGEGLGRALGVTSDLLLLLRYVPGSCEQLLARAVRVVPGAREAVQLARQRTAAAGAAVAASAGDVRTLGTPAPTSKGLSDGAGQADASVSAAKAAPGATAANGAASGSGSEGEAVVKSADATTASKTIGAAVVAAVAAAGATPVGAAAGAAVVAAVAVAADMAPASSSAVRPHASTSSSSQVAEVALQQLTAALQYWQQEVATQKGAGSSGSSKGERRPLPQKWSSGPVAAALAASAGPGSGPLNPQKVVGTLQVAIKILRERVQKQQQQLKQQQKQSEPGETVEGVAEPAQQGVPSKLPFGLGCEATALEDGEPAVIAATTEREVGVKVEAKLRGEESELSMSMQSGSRVLSDDARRAAGEGGGGGGQTAGGGAAAEQAVSVGAAAAVAAEGSSGCIRLLGALYEPEKLSSKLFEELVDNDEEEEEKAGAAGAGEGGEHSSGSIWSEVMVVEDDFGFYKWGMEGEGSEDGEEGQGGGESEGDWETGGGESSDDLGDEGYGSRGKGLVGRKRMKGGRMGSAGERSMKKQRRKENAVSSAHAAGASGGRDGGGGGGAGRKGGWGNGAVRQRIAAGAVGNVGQVKRRLSAKKVLALVFPPAAAVAVGAGRRAVGRAGTGTVSPAAEVLRVAFPSPTVSVAAAARSAGASKGRAAVAAAGTAVEVLNLAFPGAAGVAAAAAAAPAIVKVPNTGVVATGGSAAATPLVAKGPKGPAAGTIALAREAAEGLGCGPGRNAGSKASATSTAAAAGGSDGSGSGSAAGGVGVAQPGGSALAAAATRLAGELDDEEMSWLEREQQRLAGIGIRKRKGALAAVNRMHLFMDAFA